MKTNDLKINDELKRNIIKQGFSILTPIEEEAIPVILNGKDVIGIAKTGSGKTLAYGIPLIEKNITGNNKKINSLVLVPTRELAMQVRNEINSVSPSNINIAVIMGGVSLSKQIHDIKKGIDILVATPGRLKDVLNQKKISLANVSRIVLDEADTMLDMGFINDIEFILSKVASERQILLFTATMGDAIKNLSNNFLNDPAKIVIEQKEEDKPLIKEELYFMSGKSKNDFLLDYLSRNRVSEALIFTRTKLGADKLCRFLNSYGLKSVAIHSDKRQSERSRNLRFFKSKKASFLIATDIAARGIDIKNLPFVINYNLPDQAELYIHRIGRTGRAGTPGVAITICTPEEKNYLRDIEKLIQREITLKSDEKFSIDLERLGKKKDKSPYHKNNHQFNCKQKYDNKDNHQFDNKQKSGNKNNHQFGNNNHKFNSSHKFNNNHHDKKNTYKK